MNVQEIMSKDVESCDGATDLAAVASMMWRRDCGMIPVVTGAAGTPIGVITDRDICIAVATRHRHAEEIRAGEVTTGCIFQVRPDDDVTQALEMMRAHQVRRLLVVDEAGKLRGVLSLNDLLLRAHPSKRRIHDELTADEILYTLQAIGRHALLAAPAGHPTKSDPEEIDSKELAILHAG